MRDDEQLLVDVTEPLLSVDKYYKPLVADGENYATLLLIRLILMEPGLIQTHPNMGVGLISRFRYSTEVDMSKLTRIIKSQIMEYLPQFTLVDVKCTLGDDEYGKKVIKIYIRSQELNALIPINVETGDVLQNATNSLVDFK